MIHQSFDYYNVKPPRDWPRSHVNSESVFPPPPRLKEIAEICCRLPILLLKYFSENIRLFQTYTIR